MDFIFEITPNLNTLAFCLLFPTIYFIYHGKFWYDSKKLKFYDFVYTCLTVFLAAIILIRLIKGYQFLSRNEVKLLLLHLAPLIWIALTLKHKANIFTLGQNLGIANTNSTNGASEPKFNQQKERIEVVSWDELIIDDQLKQELISVVNLLKDPKTSERYGIEAPKGILLTGPPGTGKTTIAKVIATQAGLNFFAFSQSEVISKYVGDSEKNLSALFAQARKHAPSVIFIDEVDSIGRARSQSGAPWAENLLNHLLQEMDGIRSLKRVYIIAATNRADLVDAALKRPGRLDKTIEIGLPDLESRVKLFYLYLSRLPIEADIDLQYLAELTEGNSAADVAAICKQAGLNAYKRESLNKNKKREYKVNNYDIEQALKEYAKQANV